MVTEGRKLHVPTHCTEVPALICYFYVGRHYEINRIFLWDQLKLLSHYPDLILISYSMTTETIGNRLVTLNLIQSLMADTYMVPYAK